MDDDHLVQLPIDGVLDLHSFSPRDLKHLIPDYLEACHAAGIAHIRIIHGKGIGNLRRTVHAILRKSPLVENFALADERAGSWGATLVKLQEK